MRYRMFHCLPRIKTFSRTVSTRPSLGRFASHGTLAYFSTFILFESGLTKGNHIHEATAFF